MVEVSKVFCTNCGKQVDSSWKFCRYCGARQEETKVTNTMPIFTYRDYVEIHCPAIIDAACKGGVAGCPREINKMAKRLCYNECNKCIGYNDEICTKCWDQPYYEEEKDER